MPAALESNELYTNYHKVLPLASALAAATCVSLGALLFSAVTFDACRGARGVEIVLQVVNLVSSNKFCIRSLSSAESMQAKDDFFRVLRDIKDYETTFAMDCAYKGLSAYTKVGLLGSVRNSMCPGGLVETTVSRNSADFAQVSDALSKSGNALLGDSPEGLPVYAVIALVSGGILTVMLLTAIWSCRDQCSSRKINSDSRRSHIHPSHRMPEDGKIAVVDVSEASADSRSVPTAWPA